VERTASQLYGFSAAAVFRVCGFGGFSFYQSLLGELALQPPSSSRLTSFLRS
jgi:hypothetical protein